MSSRSAAGSSSREPIPSFWYAWVRCIYADLNFPFLSPRISCLLQAGADSDNSYATEGTVAHQVVHRFTKPGLAELTLLRIPGRDDHEADQDHRDPRIEADQHDVRHPVMYEL